MPLSQKILTVSVLVLTWFALGFGAIADQLDSILDTRPLAISAQFADGALDETKSCSFCGIDPAFFSTLPAGRAVAFELVKRRLDTFSTPRYQILSVYRL
jgi:hypothetical protein